MSSYLETFYSRDEYDVKAYPQKLCNHLVNEYLSKNGDIKQKKILDIGSGKGNHLVGFSRCGLQVYGLDKRKECISALEDFEIRECEIENDPFPYEDNFFDFIYSKSVMEHVTNTDNFLQQTLRVLKPGGMVVLMTPDWKSQRDCFWDDYTHVKPFTRKSLQCAMIIHGFQNVKSDYFLQLPLIWKYPFLKIFIPVISLLPDSLKWKDKEETEFRKWVYFSKEKMLLATGVKAGV